MRVVFWTLFPLPLSPSFLLWVILYSTALNQTATFQFQNWPLDQSNLKLKGMQLHRPGKKADNQLIMLGSARDFFFGRNNLVEGRKLHPFLNKRIIIRNISRQKGYDKNAKLAKLWFLICKMLTHPLPQAPHFYKYACRAHRINGWLGHAAGGTAVSFVCQD